MFAKEVCLLNTWNVSGQAKRKKVDQSADQRREERGEFICLALSFLLFPVVSITTAGCSITTSRLHYLALLSVLWDVISKYKFSFRYLGLRKAKTKHKVWNVLFHSPMNFGNWARGEQPQKPKCTYENYLSPKCPMMVPWSFPGCLKISFLQHLCPLYIHTVIHGHRPMTEHTALLWAQLTPL